MTDPLVGAILERMREEMPATSALGTVVAIDVPSGRATVALASGQPIVSLAWLAWYSPTVGDTVLLLRGDGGWVIAGGLSADVTAPEVTYVEAIIVPDATRVGSQSGAVGGTQWTWSDRQQFDPANVLHMAQNARNSSGGGRVGAAWWPPAAAVLPAGAIVTQARIAMTRIVYPWGAHLVAPRLFTLSSATIPVVSSTSALATGLGPWQPGTLGLGQTGHWDLPSAWLAGWLAGTVHGVATVAVDGPQTAGWAPTAPQAAPLHLTYIAP